MLLECWSVGGRNGRKQCAFSSTHGRREGSVNARSDFISTGRAGRKIPRVVEFGLVRDLMHMAQFSDLTG